VNLLRAVCKTTGGVDDYDGHFMRVRITIDITLPMCRGRVVTLVSMPRGSQPPIVVTPMPTWVVISRFGYYVKMRVKGVPLVCDLN